jgi:ABC-type multidrug transport system fused ATPase/permease subunit
MLSPTNQYSCSLLLSRLKVGTSFTTFLCLFLLVACVSFIQSLTASIFASKMTDDIRLDLFQRLLHLELSFFESVPSGQLLHRLSTEAADFKHSLKQLLSSGVKTMIVLIGNMIQLILISPRTALAFSSLLPVAVLIGHYYGQVLRRASKAAKEQDSKSLARLNEVTHIILKCICVYSLTCIGFEEYSTCVFFCNGRGRSQTIRVGSCFFKIGF